MTPNEVAATSVWRFMAAMDGYAQAHGAGDANTLSDQAADDLWKWVRES
jgi:hypothetical protein